MVRINSVEAEGEAVLEAAKLMAVSARTAPKTRGLDSIKTIILHGGGELERLARAMEERCEDDPNYSVFRRNAEDIRKSMAVLVIGVTGEPKKVESPLNCGACGHNCQATLKGKKIDTGDARGPMCLYQGIDLGIALGSAVKTASNYNIDNRMMYTIGVAVRKLKLMEADLITGIPLSVTGKNVYFTNR
ncbi:MAG: hypothetical protein CL874_00610 [Dehalococcoidales bacterium]|jgi:uncharacterized ferredoxin-like protein|nr:hypothetical protein [Dehalococcoidales bacterium]MDP6448581.1 DUF2148 domain-containing protein [Dehalococcoidales bacterium]MDP6576211.1 DUF2148 domain-containing protein [Dehalococcoidales bacterium]|tara:strand:+ start:447 stop:1013 length:567 start_codon:yes stop_codon:yes gene_type:complete